MANKKKKVKQGRKMLIMVSVLLVFVLANVLVLKLTGSNGQSDGSDRVTVVSIASGKVAGISYRYQDEQVSLTLDDEKIWIWDEDNEFPIEQYRVKKMLSAVSNLVSSQQLLEFEDLKTYGLDDPQCTVTILETDGKETVIKFGNKNSFNGLYYALVGDDTQTVHMIDSSIYNTFAKPLLDLAVEDVPAEDIESALCELVIGNKTFRIKYESDPKKFFYTDAFVWFLENDENKHMPIDTDVIEDMMSLVLDPYWMQCKAYKPTEAQLEEFGLKDPQVKFSIFEEDGTTAAVTLLLGKYDADYCYAMLEGYSFVYLISASDADLLKLAEYENMRPGEISLFDWIDVLSVDIMKDGGTRNLTFTISKEGAVASSKVNGKTVEPKLTEAVLSAIDAMYVSDSDAAPVASEQVLKLVFHRDSSIQSTLTMTISQHDNSNYVVEFDGEERLVSKNYITKLLQAIENLG